MGQSRFLLATWFAAACGRIDFNPIPPDAAVAAPARTIAVSYVHACGIDGTGHLLCWGADNAGELGDSNTTDSEKPVEVMSGTWREVATGGIDPIQAFTCAIRDDGALWCFGENFDGELGIGTTAVISTPVQVGADTWQHVATGTDCNACAIRDDGSLWCWGSDSGACGGSVGDGGAADVLSPVEIASGSWLDVSVGYGESCAVRADHTLWCWGFGGYYDFGNNDTSDLALPTQIGTDTSWSRVAMASRRGCAQRDDGSLSCWGNNASGEVGDGTTTAVTSAEVIAPGMTWSAVAVGDAYTCAIDAAGSLWCWGDPTYGVFGVDLSAIATTPREIDANGGWTGISAGEAATCGIRNGVVVCAGQDQYAMLGDGGNAHSIPAAVDAGWITLAGGYDHMCGLHVDGTVWCWGDAGHGNLGTNTDDQVPVEVSTGPWSAPMIAGYANVCATSAGSWWCSGSTPGMPSVIEPPTQQVGYPTLIVGFDHACGIRADNTLWCWGGNSSGQLGVIGSDGSPMQVGIATWSSVSASDLFTCAIQSNGTLWCWGRNDSFECGQSTGISYAVPTQVGVATDWAQVFGGASASTMCATKTSGLLFCWGNDEQGQAGDGGSVVGVPPTQVTSATDWTGVSVGGFVVCGLRSGAVWCWGNDTTPTAFTQATFVRVVTSEQSICALDTTGTRWCWGDDSVGELGDNRAWTTAFAPVSLP